MTILNGKYYALTLAASGYSNPTYFAMTPMSHLEFSQGGVTLEPTTASSTMVNIYPQMVQIQSPSGSVNAGLTIVTDDTKIAGTVTVSPAVEVVVQIQLWAGTILAGKYDLDPNQGSGTFDFSVASTTGFDSADEAGKAAQQKITTG